MTRRVSNFDLSVGLHEQNGEKKPSPAGKVPSESEADEEIIPRRARAARGRNLVKTGQKNILNPFIRRSNALLIHRAAVPLPRWGRLGATILFRSN